jgi:hypothetical protein
MAEPVSPHELKVGEVYFSVQFVDDDLMIPILEPLVFIGRELMLDDAGVVYFQDAEAYRDGVKFESAQSDDDLSLVVQNESEIKHIFKYDKALDVLQACALRRKKRRGDVL